MPGKSAVTENDILKLYFNATPIAGIAANAGSPLTALFLSLHTADPTDAGNQTSNETAYTGYARKSVSRDSGGFTVTGSSVSPAADQDFPPCTASPGGPLTHAALGDLSTGAGRIFWAGPLSPNITMAIGVTPRVKATSTVTEA
jgi:hypothetical protein